MGLAQWEQSQGSEVGGVGGRAGLASPPHCGPNPVGSRSQQPQQDSQGGPMLPTGGQVPVSGALATEGGWAVGPRASWGLGWRLSGRCPGAHG